ncbi:proline-rich protein [Sesamum angolense]|uniref:Proline-rich protein n=1 Tax=Sesamum angolense TaxID=2727404 RepID=A0AAE2BN68_9LAMI|nr:proline-rich protein [Sesamum angolense]
MQFWLYGCRNDIDSFGFFVLFHHSHSLYITPHSPLPIPLYQSPKQTWSPPRLQPFSSFPSSPSPPPPSNHNAATAPNPTQEEAQVPHHSPPIVRPPITLPPVVPVPKLPVPPVTVPKVPIPPVTVPKVPIPPVTVPPVTVPPVVNPPTGKPCTPPPGKATCPIDTLKLGACVDLLGGLVHIGLGDPAVNECCPMLSGLVELEAAACLCTTLKIKALNLKIYVPLALQLLVTCGKTPPPGYTCSL